MMNNDLISRSALLNTFCNQCGTSVRCSVPCVDYDLVVQAPAIDAEPVRHEGNTTFVTTDNLDAYADRIIVVQGNWCKVYYRDSDDTGVEG